MAAADGQSDNLTDDDLQSEIELVGDLVVAATSSDGPMPQDEIDSILGVHPDEAVPESAADSEPDSEPDSEQERSTNA